MRLGEVAPPDDLRKGAYLHDLFRGDPPLHDDLYAKRVVGLHHDLRRRGGVVNLDAIAVAVTEQYDLTGRECGNRRPDNDL